MKRILATLLLCGFALCAGAVLTLALVDGRAPKPPDGPVVIEQLREVARLQTLELRLHRKVSFEPDPRPSDSVWGDLATWVRHAVRKPQGRAIVFADVSLGLDLKRLGQEALRVNGRRVEVTLPPLDVQVRLLPGETEFIGSNLDSEETSQLFDRAKEAFAREVSGDQRLRERARLSAEQALRGLLFQLGFREVIFLDSPALRADAPPAG